MSETLAQSLAQKLQEIEEALGALILAYKDEPHMVETVYKARQLLLHVRTMAPGDIDVQMLRALEMLVQRRNALNADTSTEAVSHNNQGLTYIENFHRRGDLSDLERAITSWQRAVELLPPNHPLMPSYLSNLGTAKTGLFDQQGLPADLEEAISRLRMAIDLTPDGHTDKPCHLNNLGNALEKRFDRHGSLGDLEEAISQKRMAVHLTPNSHPDRPGRLNSLGSALETRFNRHGSLGDLEEAILHRRMAVNLTPNGHSNRPIRIGSLGNVLETRFDRHGSLADLEEAISHKRMAVDLTPNDHPNKPGHLNNLGNALEKRFDRQGSLVDLKEAISQKRIAVHLTPDDHPNKPGHLNNLGNVLEKCFDRLGSLADLEEAILQRQMAVKLTPDGHPDRSGRLSNLGNALEKKFLQEKALADLEDSIMQRQQAIHLMPDGHPERAAYLGDLSRVLKMRFEHLRNQNDLRGALSAAQESALSTAISARLRLRAALLWADCCTLNSTSSLQAFEFAIKLLPRIAWLGLAVDDQYFLLAETGFITRIAVEDAIVEGEYEVAMRWAEQGRSVVWQNLLSLRTPLEQLQSQHPELSSRLQKLSNSLHQGRPVDIQGASGDSQSRSLSNDPMKLAIERDDLIEEIRKKQGFESFLEPKTVDELAPAAQDGPVVVLNLGKARCDAIALLLDDGGKARVVNIPLEHVTSENAERLSERLVELLRIAGVAPRDLRKGKMEGYPSDVNPAFKAILQTLWLDYVKPIMNALAYSVNLDSPPRLWWCTTGPLAFLPLHAAGMYDTEEVGHKLSDYVVSSYTPTLSALLDRSPSSLHSEPKILTVGMSITPGAKSLKSTEEEVKKVQSLTATSLSATMLKNETATKERVLKELEQSSWVHFACHGKQVGGEPMKSGILLHDGVLELSEIVKTRLPNAQFAFFSACETAVGDGGVPEESAHLAAGMLFAGFRGVVATMWSIQDDIAPRVAKNFYQYMFRNGQPNREEAAYGLHRAIRSLQESKVDFASWVPFIYMGR